jgi:hypothetical protein
MHLWPTYYTLEICVYFLNLPQFTAELQILYSVHFPDFLLRDIIFSGMLYFHNIPENIHNIPQTADFLADFSHLNNSFQLFLILVNG